MVAIRSCVVCRTKREKKEFLRIVASDNNEALIDLNQKINKRAIYICKDKKCIENFIKMLKKSKIKLKIDVDLNSLVNLLEKLEI